MKSWLQDNDIEVSLTHSDRKSVVSERFSRDLENKMYKYMTQISKDKYIDKIDETADDINIIS